VGGGGEVAYSGGAPQRERSSRGQVGGGREVAYSGEAPQRQPQRREAVIRKSSRSREQQVGRELGGREGTYDGEHQSVGRGQVRGGRGGSDGFSPDAEAAAVLQDLVASVANMVF